MKKLIAGSLMASMLVVPTMAQDVSVYLNNERMVFDQNPIIENGRTLVPLRSIFEGLGAEVTWNPDIQEVRGITEYKEITLRVGDTSASVNGEEVILDVPAKIENGRTLVPLRFISESLNAEVKWNADEYRIDIIDEEVNLPEVKEVIEENSCKYYLCKNGEVYVEGYNEAGQLGLGHKNEVTKPVKIEALNGVKIKRIICTSLMNGPYYTTYYLSEDNNIYICGYKPYENLSLDNQREILIPTKIKELDGKEIKEIESSFMTGSTFYLTLEGDIYVTGLNLYGELGVGHSEQLNKIIKLDKINGIEDIQIGHRGCSSYFFAKNGDVYACGSNEDGQLGLGHKNQVNKITKIKELKNIIDIEFGGELDNNTYYLTAEGEVYVTGDNINGELGLGHRRKVTVPTKISGLDGIKIKKIVYGDRFGYTKYLGENGKIYISGCEYDIDYFGEIVGRYINEEIVELKGLENIKMIEIDESNIVEHKLIAENGKNYIIRNNQEGTIAIVFPKEKYDNIYSDFRSNIVLVKKDNKYGYINTNGEEIFPCIYDDIDEFYDGIMRVERNGKQGYINEEGEEFIPCIYDYVDYFNSYGLVRVTKNGKDGYLNKTGEEVLPCLYDELGEYKDGLLRAEVEGDYIYYDTQGYAVEPSEMKKALDDKYEIVNTFNNGLASVKKDGKWGYINEDGEEVIPCIYEQIGLGNGQFSEGIAPVKKDGKWGYINEKGEKITEFIYEGEDASGFYNGIARVSRNGKGGYINQEGKEIIPCEYDVLHTGLMTSDSSRFIAKKDGKYGYINREGEEIVPFEYDNIYPDVHRGENILVAEKDGKKFQVEYSGNLVELD